MTTIVDPAGTATVIYNRSGVTIDGITSAGRTQGAATQIVRYSGWSVVLVTAGVVDAFSNAGGVILPEDAEVGDLVELHYVEGAPGSAASFFLYPEVGGQIENFGTNGATQLVRGIIRKTGAGQWHCISKEYP